MIFVVENGTGMSDATSLVDVDWADAHLEASGFAPNWTNHDVSKKEGLLMTSTRIIGSSFNWSGTLSNMEQSLSFPRKNLRDREGRLITGIPFLVRASVSELADIIAETNYIRDSELGALESIKVGPISLEVSESASITKVIPDSIIRALSEYAQLPLLRHP